MFSAMLDPAFPAGARIFGRSMTTIGLSGLALVAGLLVAMYSMVLFPARVLSVYELLVRRLAPGLEERGRSAILSLTHGLTVLRTPGRFAAVFGWALTGWLMNALAFWIAFRAVGITAPYSAALFLQGIIAIGVSAPQAPGFFGVFELFGKEGLGLYGVSPESAATWAIGFHFLSFLPITFIGAWYFLRTGLSFGQLGGARAAGGAPEAAPASVGPAASP